MTTATPFVFAYTLSKNYTSKSNKPKIKLRGTQTTQSPALQLQKTGFDHESNAQIANVLYRRLRSLYTSMSSNGANGVNVNWESNRIDKWYIEAQRYGEELVIGGLIKNDEKAIQAGFKMFDWGFAHQSANGGFEGTADPFHSTSLFVQAVAHTLLVIQQSPHLSKYADRVARYKPLVQDAARWMIRPDVWKQGLARNQPYAHRRYLVATALGLTGKLTGDQKLINYAHQSIKEGLALQRPDGVNPEKGGHDSSYQIVGVVYAQRWVTYFPHDPLTPKVAAMIDKALAWEQTRVLATGYIRTEGNTRTAGQECGRAGKIKRVDYNMAIRGFAYWHSLTNNQKWGASARKISQFYYHLPQGKRIMSIRSKNSQFFENSCNKLELIEKKLS